MLTAKNTSPSIRRRHLAVCLVAGLGLAQFCEAAPGDPSAIERLRAVRDAGTAHVILPNDRTLSRRHDGLAPPPGVSRPSATFDVTNCNDSGSGSLREAAGLAGASDTISLAGLACSTITLTTGAIAIGDTTVSGNGQSRLTIDGNNAFQIFRHTGVGRLYLNGMTIANGKYTSSNRAQGGCIYSTGSVWLFGTTVRNCHLETTGNYPATGGAISAAGDVLLAESTVTGSSATSSGAQGALGGGIYAFGALYATDSTLSNNSAYAGIGNQGEGGGAIAYYQAILHGSTISGNGAQIVGGLFTGLLENGISSLYESTISGNRSTDSVFGAGVGSFSSISIANSTITANTEANPVNRVYGAGLALDYNAYAYLASTLIAGNAIVTSAGTFPSDVGGQAGTALGGSHNLLNLSLLPTPPGTISGDPKLVPLANNGGLTATHGLQSASPAIDAGSNPANFPFDQRGSGFQRVIHGVADIGAFENQGGPDDLIFLGTFDESL